MINRKYLFIILLLCSIQNIAQQPHASDTLHGASDDAVITGMFATKSLRKNVYQVRVISQEIIKARAATNVLEVLRNELGVRLSTDYTLGETNVQLMGLGGTRVKIMLDGVPLIDRDATRQSLSQIDINSIERIEIVDGPMSVVYGSDALAGVINIITKKAKQAKAFTINAKVQEESMGNAYSPFSGDGIHLENLTLNWQPGKWRLMAYGTRNNMGGWNDTAAYPAQVSKPKDQWMTGASIGYQWKKIHTWYRLDYLNESIYDAGVMNINNGKAIDKYFITNRFTHQLQADWKPNETFSLNTALSYQNHERQTETYRKDYSQGTKVPVDPNEPGYSGSWDVSTFKTFFFRTVANYKISSKWLLQPGVEIKSDETSGQRIAPDAPVIKDYAVFASVEYKPIETVQIRPGVRFSKNSEYDAPPVIPSINTKFQLHKNFDIRASYARGFRSPTLRELYFNFIDANHAIVGNPDLKAEYSNSYALSLVYQRASASRQWNMKSTLQGFYNDYRDFISMAQEAGSSNFTYFNIDRFKTTGVTLNNQFNYKNLTSTLGFSYIGRYNSYYETDKSLPQFTWTPELNSNINYEFKKIAANIGAFYKYTGALPAYYSNNSGQIYQAEQDGFHMLDVVAGKSLFKVLNLQLGVKNLFNVKRVGSTVQSGGAHSSVGNILTGYGRSFTAAISFQW